MPDDQTSHVPDLESFLQELYGAGWFSSEQALGLYQDDPMALITPISDPTTPAAPSSVFVLGMATEIGVAWQYFKLLGNADVQVEVRRSDNASMTNDVSLGTFQGFFMVDDNNHLKWGSSVTRYYQVRTVARSGQQMYFSGWSTAMPGTTLAAGSTNADLTTRMNTFAAAIQGLHLFPLAVPSAAVDLSVLSQAISVLSQKVSVLSSLPAASVTSTEVAAVSAQAASALSQALSVVSTTDAALSAAINGVSNTLSNLTSIHNVLSNRVSANSGVASVTSQEMSVADAALSVRIDTQSQSISILSQGVSVLSQSVSVQAAALSIRIDTQSQNISVLSQQVSTLSQGLSVVSAAVNVVSNALSNELSVRAAAINTVSAAVNVVSNAVSVVSQALSVQAAALSVRVDTQSQSISVLSQQVSVLSQQVSAISQKVSSVGAWAVRGLSGAVSGTSTVNLAADAVAFWNPTDRSIHTMVSVAAITNDMGLSAGVDNGRDQAAAFTSAVWVHVYFVLDGTTVKSRSSLAAPPTGPTLQGTESAWAYIGALRRGASLSWLPVILRGRSFMYPYGRINNRILNGGSATVETAVDTSSFVPPNARMVFLMPVVQYSDTAGTGQVAILRVISGGDFFSAEIVAQVTGGLQSISYWVDLPNVAQNMYYYWTVASGTRALYLDVLGYTVPNGDS